MKLVISRPKQLMDMGRSYAIWADTEQVATIEAGQQLEIRVPVGAKEIYATTHWFSCKPLVLDSLADDTRLVVKNSCDAWKLLVPLLPFYYIVAAKNRYLKILVKAA